MPSKRTKTAWAYGALPPLIAAMMLACQNEKAHDPGVAPQEDRRPKRSILLITIDTLRADHLGAYGYFRNTSPVIDAFAKQAVLFERPMTPMATTLPAHTSMMTSTHPMRHGVVRNDVQFIPADDLKPLAAMLADDGYQTAGFVSAAPVTAGTGIETGFAHWDEPSGGPYRTAGETLERVEAFVADQLEPPFFLWVHLWDPHAPFEPPGKFARRFRNSKNLRAFLERSGAPLTRQIGSVTFDVQEMNNLYDGEIRYTDTELADFFGAMKARQLWDETTVVLTADHGEGLWQHDWHDHGRIYNEQIFVPLIIKPPRAFGVAPKRVWKVVSTLDIVPTLDRLLDLPLSPAERSQFQGVDMFGEGRRYALSERVRRHRTGWEPGQKLSLTSLDWKYFSLSRGEDQLFDLREDWFERNDVIEAHPEVARAMRDELKALLVAEYKAQKQPREERPVNDKLMEKLRALGYVD